MGSSLLVGESYKRAIRGGFAAMTPQQSGAATTSASVIGTLCARSSDFATFALAKRGVSRSG